MNDNIEKLWEFLYCTECYKLTTRREAVDRNFNPGRCGHCNGELKPDKRKRKDNPL